MDGGKGNKTLMTGMSAPDVIVEVPSGTVVTNEKTGEILADLKKEGDKVLVAKGGRGGKGNACFKSSRLRAPKIAENGFPAERKRLVLELKLIADVGIIGFPSVGKSTFLNVVSRANVETAAYEFTTKVPNLGVSYLKDGRSLILADMPGLIEGAHEGRGLGITFLRHIERTKVLLHFVAMDGVRDPLTAYNEIREELKDYGASLEKRPEIVVASKMDEEGAEERKEAFDKALGKKSMPLSSLTHKGMEAILKKAADILASTPAFPLKGMENLSKVKVYDGHEDEGPLFKIRKDKAGFYSIEGEKVLLKASLINTKTDEGLAQLVRYLDSIGVEEALKKAGAVEGDEVRLGDFRFDYSE